MTTITNKKEAAAMLAGRGIALPDNWSKLSTERAIAWADLEATAHQALAGDADKLTGAELAPPEAPKAAKKVGIIGHAKAGLMAVGAALAGMGATVVEAVAAPEPAPLDKAARKNAKMKVFSDPKYRKTTRKMRRFFANNSTVSAVTPENPSRQVRRALERRANKMPLGALQAVWHKSQGFGKIGAGKRA